MDHGFVVHGNFPGRRAGRWECGVHTAKAGLGAFLGSGDRACKDFVQPIPDLFGTWLQGEWGQENGGWNAG
jgi:hypothetical protein